MRSYSSLELKNKMIGKGFSKEETEQALQFCTQLGYLNDEAEAERRQRRLQGRGYGPRMIAYKLYAKGLHATSISQEEQKKSIAALLTKSSWRKKTPQQVAQALSRRGFDEELILTFTGPLFKQ